MTTTISPASRPVMAPAWKDWLGSAGIHALILAAVAWIGTSSTVIDDWVQVLDMPIAWAKQDAPQTTALPEPEAPSQAAALSPAVQTVLPTPKRAATPRRLSERPKLPSAKQPAPRTPAEPESSSIASATSPSTGTHAADAALSSGLANAGASSDAGEANGSGAADGKGQARGAGTADWRSLLGTMLRKYKRYPTSARRMRQEGRVLVQASFSAGGEVLSCSVAEGSGFDVLDQAAVQLVRTAAAAANAEKSPGRSMQLRIPIVYELKDR